jgi:hypothetical protein
MANALRWRLAKALYHARDYGRGDEVIGRPKTYYPSFDTLV